MRKLGFRTIGPYKHEGQGTSSLGVHFENAYLELIWIDNPELARIAGSAIHVDFADRSGASGGASPFGIGLHMLSDTGRKPFPTVIHKAAWMQPGEVIHVAETASNSAEPYVFIVPASMANPSPETLPELYKKQLFHKKIREHAPGVHMITKVEFVVDPRAIKSPTLALLSKSYVASFSSGDHPLVKLTFDHHAQEKSADLRPALPVFFNY